jgi:hypothetical protein
MRRMPRVAKMLAMWLSTRKSPLLSKPQFNNEVDIGGDGRDLSS